MSLLIGILALQGDFEAHARMLERLGLLPETQTPPAADVYRFVRRAEDLDDLDGLILPGGESTTMLKFLEDPKFWSALRSFVGRRPSFGTCAGAILLAREVSRPEQRSLQALDTGIIRNAYGRQIDSAVRQAQWQPPGAPPAPLEMVFIRAPRFTHLGPDVQVLAEESGVPVLIQQGHTLAATFHPELTTDPSIHRYFLDQVRRNARRRDRAEEQRCRPQWP